MRLLEVHAPHAGPKRLLVELPVHLDFYVRGAGGFKREERGSRGDGLLGRDLVGKEGIGGEGVVFGPLEEAGALEGDEGDDGEEAAYDAGPRSGSVARVVARRGGIEFGVAEVLSRCY